MRKPLGKPASASSCFACSGSYGGGLRSGTLLYTPGGRYWPDGTAAPSITRSTIAWRLIAIDSASRTRRSFSGFLSSFSPLGPNTNGLGPSRD